MLPILISNLCSNGGLLSQSGVVFQVFTNVASIGSVIGAARDLDVSAALVSNTIAWMGVPQIRAALVLFSASIFCHCVERVALVSTLCHELG